MKLLDLPQGSAEWKAARAGKVTASRIADVLATIKTGEAAARRDYRAQIVAEILTGTPQEDGYINAEMQWGIDNEPMARSAYELVKGSWVEEVGFVLHPGIERAGASPDGLAGKDGLVEIKCPKTATHLQYLIDGKVPAKYEPQMMWQMACTGRKWCDFVSFDPRLPAKYEPQMMWQMACTERVWCDFASFDPRLPEKMQLFVMRLERDDKRIAALEDEVRSFLVGVDAMLEAVRRFA